jgi:hypothetical protein
MAPATSVTVHLQVAVDSSGNVSVFGQNLDNITNIIIADMKLPISNLYNGIDNSLIKFQENSDEATTIFATRDTAFTTSQTSLEQNLKTILQNTFDCAVAVPFSTHSSAYHTQDSFGKVAIGSYAFSLFGHVAATAAIDNDTALISYLNNDGASDASLNKLLASAIYSLNAEKSTAIARQVIGQDSSRARLEDNDANWQALEFKSGDIIYVSIALKAPIVSVSNNAQQSMPDGATHGTNTYALKITLTDNIVPAPGAIQDGINSGTTFAYSSSSFSLFTYAATSNSPTVTGGSLSSYSISPALPAGLTLNSSTGVISGTPTVVTSTTNYTITAVRADTTTTIRTISLSTSSQAPSSFSYAATPYTFTAGIPITPITPTIPGTFALGTYSVSPALPTGLSINASSGAISGTAFAITTATSYTITARRTVDNVASTTTVSIATPSPPASVLSYGASPFVFDAGNAITPIGPEAVANGFSFGTFSVGSALPTGLSLNATTGTISGTPVAKVATNYTITALRTLDNVASTTTLSIAAVNVATTGVSTITSDHSIYTVAADTSMKFIYLGPNESTVQLYASALPTNATNKTITWSWYNIPTNAGITLSSSGLITIPAGAAFTSLEPYAVASSGTITRVYIYRRSLPGNVTLESTGTVGFGTASPPTSGFIYYTSTTVTNTATYTVGTTLSTANSIQTSTDFIDPRFTISPNLPLGMFIDSFSGFIGGQPPTTSRSTANYTVTATASGQTRTIALTITVNAKAAATGTPTLGFFYSGALPAAPRVGVPYILFMGNQGGAVTSSFTVSPALPVGLSVDPTTGNISGTPTATASTTSYTVSGSNATATSSATIGFAVTA